MNWMVGRSGLRALVAIIKVGSVIDLPTFFLVLMIFFLLNDVRNNENKIVCRKQCQLVFMGNHSNNVSFSLGLKKKRISFPYSFVCVNST